MTAGDEIFVSVDMKAVISKVMTGLSMSEGYSQTLWLARAIVKLWTSSAGAELLPVLSIVHKMINHSRILQC